MQKLAPERNVVSRRRVLVFALTGSCGLVAVATGFSKTARAASTEGAEMYSSDLIKALRTVGKPVCMVAADRLAASTASHTGFDLHLRSAALNEADARVLANGMLNADFSSGRFMKSFSASYNPDLGDTGAAALAAAFPETMTELGLVGCSIGDVGGRAILEWARAAPKLRMICVEGNKFSADMRSQFRSLKQPGQQMLVVV